MHNALHTVPHSFKRAELSLLLNESEVRLQLFDIPLFNIPIKIFTGIVFLKRKQYRRRLVKTVADYIY